MLEAQKSSKKPVRVRVHRATWNPRVNPASRGGEMMRYPFWMGFFDGGVAAGGGRGLPERMNECVGKRAKTKQWGAKADAAHFPGIFCIEVNKTQLWHHMQTVSFPDTKN